MKAKIYTFDDFKANWLNKEVELKSVEIDVLELSIKVSKKRSVEVITLTTSELHHSIMQSCALVIELAISQTYIDLGFEHNGYEIHKSEVAFRAVNKTTIKGVHKL